jgi:hypothetical protein
MTEIKRLPPSLFARLLCCGVWLGACVAPAAAQTAPHQPATSSVTPSSSWQQLSGRQKQALAPLAAQWGNLTPQQQSKWLTISQNFPQLPVAEQATMHARMADWVALSPQQRNHARYNYNVVQALPKEDKKAKWEAYQALSAEDKRLLSLGTAPPAKSAASIAKPVSTQRLVAPTLRPIDSARDITRPAPSAQAIDRKTLLPKPVPPVTDNKPQEQALHPESSAS